MSSVPTFEPSLLTLTLVLALPFAFLVYRARYRFYPGQLQRGEFFFRVILIAIAVVLALRFARSYHAISNDELQLLLVHLMALALGGALISQSRRPVYVNTAGPSGRPAGDDYRPMPLNQQVERVGWEDLVIADSLREELTSIIRLLQDPATAGKYGIQIPKGILLSGPPGTGKTTIAKVVANTAGLNFFVLSMDMVVSKWVGESEKNLTRLFQTACRMTPAVLFVDEIDALGRTRSTDGEAWSENLLNHFLQLIDGVIRTDGLYLIGATNRADLVDPALKRPGRLTRVIEIPLPDFESRKALFVHYLSKISLQDRIDLDYLSEITKDKSGADIKEICNQAAVNAFKRESSTKERKFCVSTEDLAKAIADFIPLQRLDFDN